MWRTGDNIFSLPVLQIAIMQLCIELHEAESFSRSW